MLNTGVLIELITIKHTIMIQNTSTGRALRKSIVPFLMFLGLTGLSAVALTGCDDDKDDDISPRKEYVEALRQLYPAANHVDWENKAGYIVADFKNDARQEVEVWFDNQVKWAMTTTDFDKDFTAVPAAIIDNIRISDYGTWTMDDAEYVERPAGNYYIVEVEKQGSRDADLVYREDGTFVKVVPGTIESLTPTTLLE